MSAFPAPDFYLDAARSFNSELSDEDIEAYEILSGRFGRVVDILFNKVFTSIAHFEFEETSSLPDTLNFMDKKGIVHSMEIVREIKELRNQIVHEYIRMRIER